MAALSERYRLERELGEGGMATVWLANDLKHHRQVAIKVLHAELSAVLGPERFIKEITLTASLHHPHILPLFDSGSADGLLYYVMPFVDGETLRTRLDRERQLPIADAVRIASEVADALHYAHERGVVHRDIKPENILLQNGHAQVADFGIALALQHAGGQRMTQTGLSLGTPQYMSPEQAMGDREIGVASDIYSLGAVTYEMLAGEPPFSGANTQAILARVITEPARPLHQRRATVSLELSHAVMTALQQIPADRFATAARFGEALTSPSALLARHGAHSSARVESSARRTLRVATVGTVALALGVAAGRLLFRPEGLPTPAPVRFSVAPDSGFRLGRFAIAPDGSAIAFWAIRPDSSMGLFVRRLDEVVARSVVEAVRGQGAAPDNSVAFSPDGLWIAYTHEGAVEKVRVTGGAPVTVLSGTNAGMRASQAGGTIWGSEGEIFTIDAAGGVVRIPADGRTPERVLTPQAGRRFLAPRPLPGGRGLLLSVASNVSAQVEWAALDLRSGQLGSLNPGVAAEYVEPGAVVYADEGGRLIQQRFDLQRLETVGEPRVIRSSVATSPSSGIPMFATTRNGTLVMVPGANSERRLLLLTRSGAQRMLSTPASPWAPRFSPDERRIAFGAISSRIGVSDVWTLDLASGTLLRITSDSADNNDPQWSPDGRTLAFSSSRDSIPKDLYLRSLGSSGEDQVLLRRPGAQWISDWSRDGQWILFTDVPVGGGNDIWVAPAGGGSARPWLATPFSERGARFSPDGRWVAYTSTETGAVNVQIQSFPVPGSKTIASIGTGVNPVWRGDGRELYYWSGNHLMAAKMSWGADGPSITGHESLFSLSYAPGPHPNYDVTRDGQRFAIIVGTQPANELLVELNAGAGRLQ